MSLDELVRELMGDEHADMLSETIAWFVRELLEAKVARRSVPACARRAPSW